MQTTSRWTVRPAGKSRTRILQLLVAAVAILVVATFLLFPVFISSKTGQEMVLGRINRLLSGKTDFADLSMSWFRGIKIAEFRFDGSTGLTSIQVEQIATKPRYGSLLVGDIALGRTVLDQPRIQIDLNAARTGDASAKPSPPKAASVPALPVKSMDLVVKDGSFKVTDRQGKSVELSRINSQVNLRPPGEPTSFNIDMAVADAGKESTIKADARVRAGTAKKGWTLKGTTGDLVVEVNDLNLESLAPIFELAKLDVQAKGKIFADVNGTVQDGRLDNLAASIKAQNLDVTGPLLKGDTLASSHVDIDAKLTGQRQLIHVDRLDVDSDWLHATVKGVVPTALASLQDFLGPESKYDLQGDFSCDVDRVVSQMPRTFGIKEGVKVTSGRLSGQVEAREGSVAGQVKLVDLAGTVDGKKLDLSEPVQAELQMAADDGEIRFDKLHVTSAFAKAQATGGLEQIRYDGQVDLAGLQSQLGQFIDIGPYEMSGQVLGKGQVSILAEKVAVTGTSQVKDLRLRSPNDVTAAEPMTQIAFSLNIDRPNNVLSLDSVDANATLGRVRIADAILPLGKEAAKPMKMTVSASNVDLQKLQPFAVLFASLPETMQLAGIVESQLQVTAQGGTYRVVTDSTTIKNFKLASPQKEPFQQEQISLVLDAQIDPNQKAINVQELRLESPQIKIKKGDFKKVNEADKTKVQGRADLEYDWQAVTRMASQFLPKAFTAEGQEESAVWFSSQYPIGESDQFLAHLTGQADIGFEKARYLGLNFGSARVNVQFEDGLMKIAPFSTTVNNGEVRFAGQADFKKQPVLLTTTEPLQVAKGIYVNEELTEQLLVYVNPVFANSVNVRGMANFDCERLAIPLADSAKKDIEVIGTISVQKLYLRASDLLGQILSLGGVSLSGQEMTIHPTHFILRDGFLRYDDMQVDVGDNPVNFKGVIGLDKSLDMTVTLPYTTAGRTVRVGQETYAKRISVPLGGTVYKPQLDTERFLQEQLQQTLRRGLEDLFR